MSEVTHTLRPLPRGALAAVALLGLPADDKSSYLRGGAAAPGAIRSAFSCPSTNSASEDGLELSLEAAADAGDMTAAASEVGGEAGPRLAIRDLGDLELRGRLDPAAIESAVAKALGTGVRLVCLGGDHSVSYPVLRGYLRARGGGLDVLHLDAHNDLYDEFEGDRLSHACPFARAREEGAAKRLVQVGIRAMTAHLRAQVERFGVEVIDMRAWCSGARPAFAGEFYLSLDLDALDPAFAPGVSHHEPGGLSTREVLTLVQTCPGTLVGADLVELNPGRDRDGVTAMVAAKLLKEIAARLARGGAPLAKR